MKLTDKELNDHVFGKIRMWIKTSNIKGDHERQMVWMVHFYNTPDGLLAEDKTKFTQTADGRTFFREHEVVRCFYHRNEIVLMCKRRANDNITRRKGEEQAESSQDVEGREVTS